MSLDIKGLALDFKYHQARLNDIFQELVEAYKESQTDAAVLQAQQDNDTRDSREKLKALLVEKGLEAERKVAHMRNLGRIIDEITEYENSQAD